MIGRTLGHYRILEKLGEGGMGVVYRARDEQLDRDVAIKVLPAESFSDPAARARLLREARAAAALNHPHICTIHEVGEAKGQAYIAMELVEGRTLNASLPLPAEQVMRHGLQLAEALAHAHERGIVHRDFKSANVVITREGRAKVLDFGLAKRLSEDEMAEVTRSQVSVSRPGAIAGTLAYMAPEQLLGQPADARSDVWALGVVLYEMATGARPFQGQTGFELSSAILNRRPAALTGEIPLPLRGVIERCLEKEPGQRYPRGGEARAALEAIQTGAVAPWAGWGYGLKGRPWLALAAAVVLLLVVLAVLRPRWGGAPRIESLAVLPLENLSGDPAQEYFADGMTEALITDLARLKGLQRVIARGSVMRFKDTKKPLAEIARELKVDALITGAVLRSGDRVRVTAQLINPATGEQLWADRYERDLRDVLTLQNEILNSITGQIKLKLTRQEEARLASARPVNPEAHELYLQGRYHSQKATPKATQLARAYYERAITLDPQYALPYVGLAETYIWYTSELPPAEARGKARPLVQKALELDESLGQAHAALAQIKFFNEWDWASAEQEFRRAVELNPNYAEAHHFYSHLLLALGRNEESLAESQRGVALDPRSPLMLTHLGVHHTTTRQYALAVGQYQKALDLDPNFGAAHMNLGRTYWFQGLPQEAVAECQRALTLRGSPEEIGALGFIYARLGRTREAQALLQQAKEQAKTHYFSSCMFAQIYMGLGQRDQVFYWLEKAYQERDPAMTELKGDPGFDSLRSDSRFQDLLRRMKLPVN